MERRAPMSHADALRLRDAEMYRKHVERYTHREIAKLFGVSFQLVGKRFALMPASLKARIREDVMRLNRARIADFRDEMERSAHA